jgi:hypothetical protein
VTLCAPARGVVYTPPRGVQNWVRGTSEVDAASERRETICVRRGDDPGRRSVQLVAALGAADVDDEWRKHRSGDRNDSQPRGRADYDVSHCH